ncbi:peptidase S9 [Corynebacterium sphenisci DSM 44792]|uniref:Acyl-peptide hydrolase n=1 Tax=Corynebacterium sphenisci DSM 44792 TaxID=1437874 RepID=A0A1L7CWC4_9CORY|nr:DUF2920 family protein [Corynebacterium sphenisci]APT90092.1 peptidase S9 [Corynebacterium sphenisci DSM 44792]
MRQTYGSSLAPDGGSIAYLVRDGGYPRAVVARLGADGVSAERAIPLPVDGPVTRLAHSPDGAWLACEVAPRGSERLETWLVSTCAGAGPARQLRMEGDVRASLVTWDGATVAMDVVTGAAVAEARLVDPATGGARVLDRRTDARLVDAHLGHALMRVGPRGSRELLLVSPDGRWLPLLPPDPGAMTEEGVILPGAPDEDLAVLLITDHGGDRRRVLRVGVRGEATEVVELLAAADADVDELAVSEDGGAAAVLWNTGGVSSLEVLTLGARQSVRARRGVELAGMVAAGLSISADGSVLAVTVEGPGLPPAVEVLRTGSGRLEPLDPDRSAGLVRLSRADDAPELVRFTARDGLELSGWVYHDERGDEGPRPTYIHLHGGPERQARPGHHDILATLVDSGITVFTPNIRGSSGAGRAFQHADDRYGRFAAIKDVVDAAAFLVDAGIADPRRLAVGGRSYGGYLALLAAALEPGIFRAVVDACGMTSFASYFESTEPWLASAAYPKYGYPMHDAELLEAISPLTHAPDLRAPVLFIHGAADGAVPPAESDRMRRALLELGRTAELLLLPDEGHQFVKPRSRRRIAGELLRFLGEHGMLAEAARLRRFD